MINSSLSVDGSSQQSPVDVNHSSGSILIELPYLETHSWDDILSNETKHPELQGEVENMLIHNLGYLPGKDIGIQHYPFLRTLLHYFLTERLDLVTYFHETRSLMKDLRNKDVLPFTNLGYSKEEYATYSARADSLRIHVRRRLETFLGYAPDLHHSMAAEMLLQNSILRGRVSFTEKSGPVDHKAMTIIKYRELLLTRGKDAANQSDLWYFHYTNL